jgi:hypothetical protein
MGSPLLLAVALAVVLLLPFDPASSHATIRVPLATALGVILGCRLAYHLHMRRADAYDGAYTDPAKFRGARIRYTTMCVLYGAILGYLAHWAAER